MLRLLSRLFIKNRDDVENPQVRRAYGTLCGVLGVALNIVLFAAKWLAGTMTGSIAIRADAFNNLSDAGSSVITLIGFKVSGKRHDVEHPFGHGRAEYVAGLIVAMVIVLMGFDLARSSVEKIFAPEAVSFSMLSAAILLGSILVKLYMAAYNRSVGRKIHSVAMEAAALDSLSDVAATSAVLLSSLAGHFFDWNVDAYAGALVSLMILKAGYDAAKDTISPLLGNPPDPEFVRRVYDIVNSYDVVHGVHDLVVHDYGPGRVMLSLHAEVPADGNFSEIHDVIDTIERRLSAELGCQAVIHMDPIATDDALVAQTRDRVLSMLRQKLNPGVTIHDFRMVAGPTHTNVIFDAVVPLQDERSDEALRQAVCALVREMDGDYYAVVNIDRPYAGE